MVVREEVELVQEVANINAAQRVHLGERKDAWEPKYISTKTEYMCLGTHLSSFADLSGVYQLTLTTFSYSSELLIGIGM